MLSNQSRCTYRHLQKSLIRLSIALGVGMGISASISGGVAARTPQMRSQDSSANGVLVAEAFNPPERGAPPRTTEGGTRGCGTYTPGQKPLTALTPGNAMPLTLKEHPTWYWYVPPSDSRTLEFTLLDEKDEEIIYQTNLPVPAEGGIVSHSLPADVAAPLEKGQTYHWYLAMICNPEDRTGDMVVDGWIERIAPDRALVTQLENAPKGDRAEIYARQGIWHDALHAFAQLRQTNPDSPLIVSQWQEFLNSVELGEFTSEPFIEATEISQE